MHHSQRFVLAGILGVSFPGLVQACDWPQWHGPNRNNISPETDWAIESAKPTVWTRNVGLGYSNVVVAGGRLYTAGFNEEAERDFVFCLNPDDGEVIWSQDYPGKKWDKFHGGGTNTTPSIDGDRVYVFTRDGEYRCFDAATGEIKWLKNIAKDYDVELPTWGFAASPLILDDMIVLNAGRAIAFDRESGTEIWQSENFGHAYSTPVDFELEGRRMLALFCGDGLIVLERETGKTVDVYEWKTRSDINPATPVVIDHRLFISSGYNHGCSMLELRGGKLYSLWENKNMRNQMTGCVLIGEHLYGFDQAELKCLNLDGHGGVDAARARAGRPLGGGRQVAHRVIEGRSGDRRSFADRLHRSCPNRRARRGCVLDDAGAGRRPYLPAQQQGRDRLPRSQQVRAGGAERRRCALDTLVTG